MLWGRKVLLFGVVMALLSATPALLVYLFPLIDDGFFGTLAIMLTLTVTPLGVAIASVGAILLLVGVVRRRGRP
jgi:energy-converting hydrogenase Eha subunit C